MKKQKTNKLSTVTKVVAVGVLAIASGLAGAGIHNLTTEPQVLVQEKIVNQSIEVPVEVIKEVPVNVTVEKLVEVDNGQLDAVLQAIYDHDGDVEFLTEDLKDSEVAEIADRVVFINEAKVLAQSYAQDEIADLVDKEDVNGNTLDEDDVERIKVEDEFDKLTVEDIDYDDKDVSVLVPVKFEHDDVDYEAVVKVVFKDGEYDDVELVSVDEE